MLPVDANQRHLKTIAYVAFAGMGALFILGIIFYKERVLFADASYVVFNIINSKSMMIQEKRYGSFITQMFPYLGQKFHLPLRSILVLYGISFHLFFLSVSATLVFGLKQYYMAILMSLYYFLFFSESFIWVNEIAQGTAWMFLLLAVLLYLGKKKVNFFLQLLLLIPLSILTIFTHFIVIMPLGFLLVYLILEKNIWPFSTTKTILLGSILMLVMIIKFASTNTSYDTERLQWITNFSLHDVINSFQTPVVQTFLGRCITNYWLGMLVFIVSIASLLLNRKRIQALWTLISTVGYIVIMGLAYRDLDANAQLLHIESEWSCIAIIIATPFVLTFLPGLKALIAAGILSVIFIIRLAYIITFIMPFRVRNIVEEQILTQMKNKGITKLALYNDPHLMTLFRLPWALSYETIMASAIDDYKPQLTFFFINPNDKDLMEKTKATKGVYDAWNMVPANNLDKEYFSIDTGSYRIMSYTDFLK